ncbi:hypothetical protein SAMN06265361_101569 [Laceyella tengchongensis]|uniref:Uncharacterized protein n=1 Tax=Laceyella tengchongensis TaxID=574699 RepID=A0AA46ADH0_9BACL|nr:hypothetical protein SAMN06265361_101569 [Laceyella tengchongensis]
MTQKVYFAILHQKKLMKDLVKLVSSLISLRG